jgi:aminoglycoside 6-adenylyltransferase
MLTLPSEEEVLDKFIAWGNAQPTVQAMIMTSTRTRPNGPVDLLSDYDIIIAVTDPERFAQKDDWVSDYGAPMVRWGDESELCGLPTYFRGVVYQDYVKIDWSIWPDAMLERIAEQDAMPEELDAGYRILLDKDGRTAGWKPPTVPRVHPRAPDGSGIPRACRGVLVGRYLFCQEPLAG